MSNQIVIVNVSQQQAPTPSKVQRTGAFVSQGGTTLTPGTYALLSSKTSLAALLVGGLTLASLTSSGTVATATLGSTTIVSGTYNTATGLVNLTLTASIGVVPGALVAISGATGSGSFASIDGTFQATAGSGGTTLEYTVAAGLTMTITGGNAEATLGLANSSTFITTIAGAAPSGYNGTVVATVTSPTTFTYVLPSSLSSPATGTITFTQSSVGELQAMNTTFWAQGSQTGVYVIELGGGTPAQGVTALGNFITANAQFFYSYLVPRSWGGESTFITFANLFTTTTSKTFFFTTLTLANYASWLTTSPKSVLATVEAPGIPITEFDAAAIFFVTLTYDPSSTNPVPPLAFAYVFGVTQYPLAGNSTLLATLRAANINVIGTGAEGGDSNTIVFWGHMLDGHPFNYWYSADWLQINIDLDIANAVIAGSNIRGNPLYDNQDGINRLQAVAQNTIAHWISYGLGLGNIVLTELPQTVFLANFEAGDYAGNAVLNAEPFNAYYAENPNDYAIGKYGGFTVAGTPKRGFEQIIFNVIITLLVG